MFSIECLELISCSGESFRYSFSSGVNYIQGPNSSGKTEFYNFLDYMLGAEKKKLSESPWFKGSLQAAKMQISLNGHGFSLYRDLAGDEFGLVIDGIPYKVSDLAEYRNYLNTLFLESADDPTNLSEYAGQELTYRTFNLFCFLNEVTVGRINGFFSKLLETKYRVKQRPLFDYLFSTNPDRIVFLQRRIAELSKRARELESQRDFFNHYLEAVNQELAKLGIVERFDGRNVAVVSELIETAAVSIELNSSSSWMANDVVEADQLRSDIKAQKQMIRELKGTKAQDEKRYRLLDRLNSLIADDGSRADLLGQTCNLLGEIETAIPRKDLDFQQELLARKESRLAQLEAKLTAANVVFNPLDFNEKSKAVLVANEYLSRYSALCKPDDLEDVKTDISRLKRELLKLKHSDDNASINSISDTVTDLYHSASQVSSFVESDFKQLDFHIKFQKEGVGLQPTFSERDDSVDLFTGSRARHSLMQICGYFAFMHYLLPKRNIPLAPLLVFDHVSSPFDEESRGAIGAIISKFYSLVDKVDVQLFLFETEDPDALGIVPDEYISLVSDVQTGFNPFYTAD